MSIDDMNSYFAWSSKSCTSKVVQVTNSILDPYRLKILQDQSPVKLKRSMTPDSSALVVGNTSGRGLLSLYDIGSGVGLLQGKIKILAHIC